VLLQRAMLACLTRLVLVLRSALDTRASREAEILVLRHQLMALNRKSRTRVRLRKTRAPRRVPFEEVSSQSPIRLDVP